MVVPSRTLLFYPLLKVVCANFATTTLNTQKMRAVLFWLMFDLNPLAELDIIKKQISFIGNK